MSSEPGAISHEGHIGLCEPNIEGNEWTYIKQCLDTGWVSSAGEFVDRFEREVAEYLGNNVEAVAVVNGTSALHMALYVSGVAPGDEVILPALTFIAPANAVRYCGARPVLIDVDPKTWQLDTNKLSRFIDEQCEQRNGCLTNIVSGRRVKAILPVHILGHPVDMDPVLAIAESHNLIVIEDATESLGAFYKGQPIGTLGQIACLSFNGNKLITTGGGGMVITSNPEWAARVRYLTTQAKDDPIEYIHGELGFNYRLVNLQAAMGCAQLEQIDQFIQAKQAIATRYDHTFTTIPGIAQMPRMPWARCVFWLYTILVDKKVYGLSRRELMAKLDKAGIQSRPLWQPLHQSPALIDLCQSYEVEAAEYIQRHALSLPSSTGLSIDDQERIISIVADRAART